MITTIEGKRYRVPDGMTEAQFNKAMVQLVKGEGEVIANDEAINTGQSNSALNVLGEIAGSINKSIIDTIDFLGTDTVNAILGVSGSEYQLPMLKEIALDYDLGRIGYMPEGLPRDAARAVGETIALAAGGQTAIRKAPEMATEFAETALQNPTFSAATTDYLKRLPQNIQANLGTLLKAARNETPEQAAAYGALAAGGGQVGEEYGGAVGRGFAELATPLVVPSAGRMAHNAVDSFFSTSTPKSNMFQQVADKYKEKVIDDRVTRSGVPIEDVQTPTGEVIKGLESTVKEIGDDAILADVDDNFRRTLREKVNESGYVEQEANSVLNKRQQGQEQRISDATTAGGYTADVDQAIEQLREQTQPAITELYRMADTVPMELTPWLKKAIKAEGELNTEDIYKLSAYKNSTPEIESDLLSKNTIFQLQPKVENRLANYELLGKPITDFSIINETKKVLDDEIARKLNSSSNSAAVNEIRQLTGLKNRLLEEADAMNPYYAQARNLFAGKSTLENAAKQGESFLHPSITASDIKQQTRLMSDQEKDFYFIGARKAILDKIEKTVQGGNLARKLFNKTGDKDKLRTLFRNESDFKKYLKTLETEYSFAKTKNAAQGNSTTALQASDMLNARGMINEIIENIAEASTGNPTVLPRMIKNLVSRVETPSFDAVRDSQEYKNTVYEIGQLMLLRGDELKPVIDLAKNANKKKLQTVLKTLERDQNLIQNQVDKVYKNVFAPITYSEMGYQRE